MCIKSMATYTLSYKINVLSIPPLKELVFRTIHVTVPDKNTFLKAVVVCASKGMITEYR